MRKLLFSAVILATTALTANAQSGTILLAGDIGYANEKEPSLLGDTKTNAFLFNPTIGYQFNDNWTAGITGGLSMGKSEQDVNVSKTNIWNAGPFIRYSKTLSDLFSVYGQLEGRYGQGKTTFDDGVSSFEEKFNQTQINLFPAVFINLNKGFGLNFNIGGITYDSQKPDGGEATTTFGFTFGKSVGIGVSKNF